MPDPASPVPLGPPLTIDQINAFIHALVAARDSFGVIARKLAKAYGIGPRGPWIVGMIGHTAASPNELASRLRIGRSLTTAELNALQKAELIRYRKSSSDGRRVELSLTPRGEELDQVLADELDMYFRQLSFRYPQEQILFCARLLSDFSGIIEADRSP